MASALAVQREMLRVAETLYRADALVNTLFEEDVDVTRISITLPTMDRGECMAVVNATVHGEYAVAFHGGATLHECLLGVLARLENRSLKWKQDKFRT